MTQWMTVSNLPSESDEMKNTHALVRKTIVLPKGSFELRISACDRYILWINGVRSGQGPMPSYPQTAYYDAYHLDGGQAVTIAVHIYYQGLVNRVFCSGEGRFGLWAEITDENKQALCHCDESWKSKRISAYSGDTVGYETQFLENLDSRLWPEGWEKPDYNDNDWEPLVLAEWTSELLPRTIKMLHEEKIRPQSKTPIENGLLLDFGKELVGTLCAVAKGKKGDIVTLRFGEELNEEGRVFYDMRCGCRYEEKWTLSDGACELRQYDYKAFRYAEIFSEQNLSFDELYVLSRSYPLNEELCVLNCPAEQAEDIFNICKNAVKCCSQEGYLDCATREKGQYLGDSIITSRSQVWLSGSTELLRKCIRDFLESAKISKTLLAVAPCTLRQEIADFSLLFPLLPLTDYEFTGDRDFLAECYPVIKTMTDTFAKKYSRPDGLLENVRELWNLVDWPENMRDGYDFALTRPEVADGCHNVVNALWVGANMMRERIEDILGVTAQKCSQALTKAFVKTFYRSEARLFADSEESNHCSLHANIYAAWLGMLPNKEAEDEFVKLITSPDRYCGVFPMYFAMRALAGMGRYDTLWSVLTRTDRHGWRNMLNEGATACFEAWGKDQKWNTSLCHPWASGPITSIIEDIAGFRLSPNDAEHPDGFVFSPHIPEAVPCFELCVPFRGKIYQIKKISGKPPVLERINNYAVPENE